MSFPEFEVCGWALVSLGIPWVAQRVCPMPNVPGNVTVFALASKSDTLPLVFTSVKSLLMRATPALSYPLYSRRFNPLMIKGRANRFPTYPTIPHIYSSFDFPIS